MSLGRQDLLSDSDLSWTKSLMFPGVSTMLDFDMVLASPGHYWDICFDLAKK